MDLFQAAGIETDTGGRGKRTRAIAAPRSLRVPLINYKVIKEALTKVHFDASKEQLDAAARYAKRARNPKFAKEKETAVRNIFFDEVLGTILGYRKFDPDQPYSLAFERPIRRGAVDVALGRFPNPQGVEEIIAPFEMKGPDTSDLDAIMPGRGKSPVQQAWEYAIDAPGSRWVLVSNCVEIRLYAFGRGRDAYESFDLTKIDDSYELERLWLVLASDRFIGGETDRLLRETDSAYKTITNELYKQYSELRERLVQYLTDAKDGPKLILASAIEPAQKILDRILFIAFAQRTALLPDKLLERASKAANEFNPVPVWKNFLGLFEGVDKGSGPLNIWPYNGGLFAHDPRVDSIVIPDDLAKSLAALGEWDYRDDVPVTLLGHLFEQSITDLEKLRAESRGEEAPKVTKRKREGVVYTPDIVTRFLVERTIGATLSERFVVLLTKHGKAMPENGDPIFAENEQVAERAFWRDYAEALRALRIVDPACGSGAFLVAAFDLLAAEYRRVVEHLAVLGEAIDFDPFDEIVTKNLYGVDLNTESVEITRLALWLKTARNQHRLQNLEATIKVGNSLIDDKAFTDHPFDWRAAFPEIFAQGGFDIVIGNPPYVRMELIKPVKPYLEKHYVVADERTDLYAYFFERGIGVLKEGGRLGYISSSTFFRTGSGENLRKFLGDNVAIEAVVDFGDLQIFEGVTTYPAIVTLRKGGAESDDGRLSFLKVDELPKDLDAEFSANAQLMPRARLGAGSWQFEDDSLARLRDKIVKGRKTLGEVYGAPLYGIKTGFNEAFIVDQETRDRLVKQDKKSTDLLVPFVRGENIKRWRVESEGLFLINTPKGKVDINAYPAVRDWLLPFKASLEKRATKQEWYELQQAQLAYQPGFRKPKIVYLDIANSAPFAFDDEGIFIDCTIFMIPGDRFLLAFLNSKAAWFQWIGETPIASGGYIRLKQQYVAPTALPDVTTKDRDKVSKLSDACRIHAKGRYDIRNSVEHRMLDLAPPGRTKLSRKLQEWWTLDFSAFRDEVKRVFKAEIPVKERGEWEAFLAKQAAEVKALDAEIEKAECEIDAIVYRLFDLTAEEIALLEASIAGQH
ncbi:MAG: N-6 DNA methylase [Pseudolabrys sp.]|nr:N-6 DNA methylase [Pseudolabrys sp.]MDP2298061.1 N-6 DNA methylase [Pseudolabrys sp.]